MIHNLFLLLILFVLSITPVLSQESTSVVIIAPGEPIIIGVSLGLSGGTAGSALGVDAWRGISLAQEDAPALEFDEQIFPLLFDLQETDCSSEGGATTATYFSADARVVGILGPICTASCLSAAPIYDEAGYSLVSPGCTSVIIQQRAFASFNHTLPVNSGQAIAAAHYLYETLGIRQVATIHEDNDYSASISTAFDEAFQALGGEILARVSIDPDEEDYQSTLSGVAATVPEALYFAGYVDQASRILIQREETGLGELPIFGPSAWFSSAVPEQVGAAADQNIYVASNLPAEMTDERRERQEAFFTHYKSRFSEAPISHLHDNAYDAYVMLRAAIEQVGMLDEAGNLQIDRAELAAALRAYGPVEGLSGPIDCDGTGECVSTPIGIWQIQEGAFTLIEQIDTANGE